jgi:hypothetical protein
VLHGPGHFIVRMAQDAIGSSSSFSFIQTLLSRHPRCTVCCAGMRRDRKTKKLFVSFMSRFVYAANKSLIAVSRNPENCVSNIEMRLFCSRMTVSDCRQCQLVEFERRIVPPLLCIFQKVYTTTKTTILFRIELIH